jgi:hypothetical protein
MRERIIIGENENVRIYYIFDPIWRNSNISESPEAYRLTDDMFPTGLYVIKDSDEGNALKEWLNMAENRNNKAVHNKFLELILPRITAEEFMSVIKRIKTDAYDRGHRDAKSEIRNALGIY